MRVRLPAVAALALAAICAGCDFSLEGCADGPEDLTLLLRPAVSEDGTRAFVPGVWEVANTCFDVPSAGGVAVVDLASHSERTIDLPDQPGTEAAIAAGLLVLPVGEWRAGGIGGGTVGPGSTSSIMTAAVGDVAAARVKPLGATAPGRAPVAGIDAVWFLVEFGGGVVAVTPGQPPLLVTVPGGAFALAAASGRVWIASSARVMSVSADGTFGQALAACTASSLAPVGPDHLLLACYPDGLGLLDTTTGAFAVVDTATTLAVTGTDTLPLAAVTVQDTAGAVATRGFSLAAGVGAAETSGLVLDAAAVGPRLFVTTGSPDSDYGGSYERAIQVFDGAGFTSTDDADERFYAVASTHGRVLASVRRRDPLASSFQDEVVELDTSGSIRWSAPIAPPPGYYHWR